jgi:hypothetical protein
VLFFGKVAALRQKFIALRISGRSRLATCPDSRRAQKRASFRDEVNILVKNGEGMGCDDDGCRCRCRCR